MRKKRPMTQAELALESPPIEVDPGDDDGDDDEAENVKAKSNVKPKAPPKPTNGHATR